MGAEFDARKAFLDLQRRQALKRRRRYRISKLDRYRAELANLRLAGATLAQLQLWLQDRRLKVSRSTIHRYLLRLPELANLYRDADG